ncbi:hypothetical protein SESBI_34484, partial [Sesbania bispinosa]
FLCSLKVKSLIIPSVPKTSRMWKRKYGFKDLSTSIADFHHNKEDNQTGQEPQTQQTEIPISLKPQMEQAKKLLLD